jgi:hypothetical protein
MMTAGKALENLQKGMDVANRRLTVGRLISPQQVASDQLDAQSMMTYIAMFQTV